MGSGRVALALVLSYFLPAVTSFAIEKDSSLKGPPTQTQASMEAWKKVDPSKVCMVTDMLFSRAQIPVRVKESTYYGCCENCKSRLSEDPTVREAIDPISGKKVDKSKASIAAGPEGNVAYFENDLNLNKYISTQK